ncbi:MAG: hypothetical protein V1777_04800 [Candidatus Micrarchaeota archaeon]
MNKGFSALWVLLAAGALLTLASSQNQAATSFHKAQIAGLENETASYWRTALENAVDQTVLDNLKIQTALQNPDGTFAKETINRQLFSVIQKIQADYPFISFFDVTTSADSYDMVLYQPAESISLQKLNEQSIVFFVSTPAGTTGHYAFTGGILRNQTLAAEIQIGSTKTFFLVPIGYEQTAFVVAP